ncbi:MAG: tetratricopeptide repeat protein [Clostridia bacterium]|nr:tetratricopeptide repeat protein [Clostridia bacterium]
MSEIYGKYDRVRAIPQQRVIEKMDAYMDRRDYAGAERHLLYWLEEARMGGDLRGMLMVRNELVGHYRKTEEWEKAMASADAALELLERLDFDNTISAGTTYVNIATMLNAYGDNARAIEYFEKARPLYEQSAATRPALLGGLYNNMALTCVSLKRFDEADALYDLAMDQMAKCQNGALEQAVTCLNRANLVEDRDGLEAGEHAIYELLEQASALLRTPELPRDGYYAYVCEKCAPTYDYYGWFAEASALNEEAERIYAAGN